MLQSIPLRNRVYRSRNVSPLPLTAPYRDVGHTGTYRLWGQEQMHGAIDAVLHEGKLSCISILPSFLFFPALSPTTSDLETHGLLSSYCSGHVQCWWDSSKQEHTSAGRLRTRYVNCGWFKHYVAHYLQFQARRRERIGRRGKVRCFTVQYHVRHFYILSL